MKYIYKTAVLGNLAMGAAKLVGKTKAGRFISGSLGIMAAPSIAKKFTSMTRGKTMGKGFAQSVHIPKSGLKIPKYNIPSPLVNGAIGNKANVAFNANFKL